MHEDIDVVSSMSSPFHIHLIGYIVSIFTGKPWLAEIRDPIGSTNPDRDDGVMTRIADYVEGLVVRNADKVVWLDGIQMRDEYLQNEYDAGAGRLQKLPFLGFVSKTFEELPSESYDEFTVTYAGSFYEGWIEPYRFLEGVSKYADSNEELRVQFYGDWNNNYQEFVEELGIQDSIETKGFVPHKEVVPALKGSDAVLYIGGDNPDNRLSVPSKIWDYIGSRTPIIAIVDPSFRVADLIRNNNLGIVISPDDTDGIAEALRSISSGDLEYSPDEGVFDKFSRRNNIDEYAEVLDSLISNGKK